MNFYETLTGYQRTQIPALAEIIGTRIYPVEATQGVAAPYCVFAQVSGDKDAHHGGLSGWGEIRVSYDFYAPTQAEAMDAAAAIAGAFEGVSLDLSPVWRSVIATAESEFDGTPTDDGLRHRHLDLIFTYNTK